MKLDHGQEFRVAYSDHSAVCLPRVSDPPIKSIQNHSRECHHKRDKNREARFQWVGVTNKQALLGIF